MSQRHAESSNGKNDRESFDQLLGKLGFYKPRPPRRTMLKITQTIDRVLLSRMFLHATGKRVAAFVWTTAFVVAVGSGAIRDVGAVWFAIVVFFVLELVRGGFANIARPFMLGAVADLSLGKPLFGKLGGYRHRQLEAYDRLSQDIELTMNEGDERVARQWTEINAALVKSGLLAKSSREQAIAAGKQPSRRDRKRQEAALWATVRKQLVGWKVDLNEYLGRFTASVVPNTIERNNVVLAGALDWMQMFLVVAIVLYLQRVIDHVWLGRALAICSLLAAMLFALYTRIDYEKVTVPSPAELGDPDITAAAAQLGAADKRLIGTVLVPVSVTRRRALVGHARAYLLRAYLPLPLYNIVVVIWLAIVSLLAALAFTDHRTSTLIDWYGKLAAYVAVGSGLLIVIFVVISVLLARPDAVVLFVVMFIGLPFLLTLFGLPGAGDSATGSGAPLSAVVLAALAFAVSKVLEETIGSYRSE